MLADDAAVAARADIRFLLPAREGDVLVAEAVELRRFGRSGIYDVTVSVGDEVVAESAETAGRSPPASADPRQSVRSRAARTMLSVSIPW